MNCNLKKPRFCDVDEELCDANSDGRYCDAIMICIAFRCIWFTAGFKINVIVITLYSGFWKSRERRWKF